MLQRIGAHVIAPVALLVFACLCVNKANAQGQGTVSGLVTDNSGSVLASAQIKLTNQQTGFSRTSQTNESGNYYVPALVVGKYTLEITSPGFSTYKQTDITVNVNDNIRVDAQLQLSSVRETVEVQAETVQVRAEDATVGQVVNSTQVEALSVNGRNFTSLAALVPGASSTQPSLNTPVGVTSNTSISFNGMRVSNNVWRMDGQENYDRGCGGCVVALPSVEAISEFKVETANSAVDTGFGNAGQVNVSTKSGSRDFHGTGWEYLRNEKMDANNFFTNLNGQPKPPLRFNVYGYNISGPVFIPKLYPKSKSKTFFFFNEEWRKLRQSTIFNVPAPTLAERTGNFSGMKQIVDPDTKLAVPGNIIPANRIDANALILAAPDFIFPLPTNPNGNYTKSFGVPTNLREEIVRIDHSFSDREQVFFRFIQESNNQNFTNNLWSGSSYPTTTTLLKNNPKMYLGQLTSTISPTAVNTVSLGYTKQPLDLSLNGNYQRPPNLNIPQIFPENRENRLPNIQLNGPTLGVNYDLASWPWSNALETWVVQDNFTLTRGDHTFTLGGIYMHFDKQQDLFGQTQGAFQFNGSFTGNEFADLLYGRAFQYSELQTQYKPNYLSRSGAIYLNDNWKATSKLTVTLGLRWDAFPHAYEEKNRVSSFYVDRYDPAQAPSIDNNGRIRPGTGNLLNGLGLAGENGIPRGLVQNHWNLVEPRVGIAWRPFGDDTVIRTGYGIYYERVQGNDIYNVAPNPPFSSTVTIFNTTLSNPGGAAGALIPASLTVYDPAYPTAQIQQYNFGIQRRITGSVVADVSYVGTKGTHLSDTRNINQPYPSGTAQVLAGANVNTVRPYLGYANINQYNNGSNSNYNALQASLRSDRFHGLTLQASYTYSHAIDYVSGDVPGNAHQDAYHAYLERGNSDFDRTQMFILSYVYDIPAPGSNKFVKAVLGNWQLSGISVFETGTPVRQPNAISLPGDNAGVGSAPYRPDLVKDPNKGGTRQQWFDPTAFAKPAPGNFGNAGRNIVRGAGLNNTDASLFRNFPRILGVESSGLQFRAEFYNLFNHTQWNSYGTTFGVANFGQAIGARDPRTVQLGLRLFF
jgi:hypothetical protein